MRALILIAALAVGLGLPVVGLYLLTRRSTKDDRDQVSTEWRDEQLRGRR